MTEGVRRILLVDMDANGNRNGFREPRFAALAVGVRYSATEGGQYLDVDAAYCGRFRLEFHNLALPRLSPGSL